MTSLIFGSIYMGHKGIIEHRRKKQNKKNYERWEDLRDDYDAQRKITRERRSLDVQPTGDVHDDRGIFTLRDQQEADDARTSWRPQEVFDGPTRASVFEEPRRASADIWRGNERQQTYAPPPQQPARAIQPQKTGATWDEGLPPPLRVARRNWDEFETPSSRQSSVSRSQTAAPKEEGLRVSRPDSTNVSRDVTPNGRLDLASADAWDRPTRANDVEPIESHVPGGMMAELIERGY